MALTTYSEIRLKCRPVSDHFENDRITTFIPEAEMLDVKPLIGDQLYIDLCDHQTGTSLTDNEQLLLDGGTYEVDGRKYIFSGLKQAIAYYVYSRLIRSQAGQLTRFGFVQKETDVSSNVEAKERRIAADDAAKVANEYMNECIQFIDLNKMKDQYTVKDTIKRTFTINAIGD